MYGEYFRWDDEQEQEKEKDSRRVLLDSCTKKLTKTKHGQKAGGILEGGLQQAAQMYDNSVTSLS